MRKGTLDVPEPEAPTPRTSSSFTQFIRNLLPRIFTRSENFVTGKYWLVEVLFVSVLFTILFSGGVDDRLIEANNNYWYPAYFQKIEHPLLDVAKLNKPATHDAKLNFRLTVPVILHVLHVPSNQRWILPVLAAAGTCALIFITCVCAFRITGDRVCGLYAALAVSTTYIGSFAFTMYYDSIAVFQLALAMLPGLPSLARGVLVFTAAFTDERALLASPMLIVQTLCSPHSGKSLRERWLHPNSLAVLAGMLGYAISRMALEKFAGLTSPFEGTGLNYLLINLPFWHAGIWLALKGGWLLVLVAAFQLWQHHRRASLALFLLTMAMSIGGGFLVEDVARSTAYVFPAFLIAIMIAAEYEDRHHLRSYIFAAFLISTLAGNYNIWRSHLTWFEPAFARVIAQLLHLILGFPISIS